jgi:uncharacterized lipoprotein YehR (DUF1307 family)
MTTRRLAFLTTLLALALAACAPLASAVPHATVATSGGDGASTNTTVDNFAKTTDQAAAPPADMSLPGQPQSGVVAPGLAQAAAPAAADRIVVKTANLSMVVTDPADAVQRISTLANGLGGFVVSSNTTEASVDSRGNKIMQASLTVRVPSAQLDAALTQIRAMAVEVKSVNVTGQDVTAQYTDLQSQLRNAQAAEAKLQEIMDKATKTEDVMAVFNQLIAVRQQVETLQGQIKYYDESAAMSAVTLDLIPDALNQPIAVGGWQPQGVAKDALESLVRAFQGLATGVIWIGLYVLPLALVILLPLYAVLRLVMRRIRKPRPVAA